MHIRALLIMLVLVSSWCTHGLAQDESPAASSKYRFFGVGALVGMGMLTTGQFENSVFRKLLDEQIKLSLFTELNTPKLVRVTQDTITKNIGWVVRSGDKTIDVCDCETGYLLQDISIDSIRPYAGVCEKQKQDWLSKPIGAKLRFVSLDDNGNSKFSVDFLAEHENDSSSNKTATSSQKNSKIEFDQVTISDDEFNTQRLSSGDEFYIAIPQEKIYREPNTVRPSMFFNQNALVLDDVQLAQYNEPIELVIYDVVEGKSTVHEKKGLAFIKKFPERSNDSSNNLCNNRAVATITSKDNFDVGLKVDSVKRSER